MSRRPFVKQFLSQRHHQQYFQAKEHQRSRRQQFQHLLISDELGCPMQTVSCIFGDDVMNVTPTAALCRLTTGRGKSDGLGPL